MSSELLRLVGALSFGGTLGAGVAGLVWLLAVGPTATAAFTPVLVTGALLGTALWRPIEWAWNYFLGPVGRRIRSGRELERLKYLRKQGLITTEQYEYYLEQLLARELELPPPPGRASEPRILPP